MCVLTETSITHMTNRMLRVFCYNKTVTKFRPSHETMTDECISFQCFEAIHTE